MPMVTMVTLAALLFAPQLLSARQSFDASAERESTCTAGRYDEVLLQALTGGGGGESEQPAADGVAHASQPRQLEFSAALPVMRGGGGEVEQCAERIAQPNSTQPARVYRICLGHGVTATAAGSISYTSSSGSGATIMLGKWDEGLTARVNAAEPAVSWQSCP